MTHHRLVSAYEDKVAPESGYPRVRALLQRRYGGVSFPNFARLVAARAARRCGGGGVVGGGVVRVLGPRQLVDAGRRAAVRRGARLRGGRDDAQRSVETWTWRS